MELTTSTLATLPTPTQAASRFFPTIPADTSNLPSYTHRYPSIGAVVDTLSPVGRWYSGVVCDYVVEMRTASTPMPFFQVEYPGPVREWIEDSMIAHYEGESCTLDELIEGYPLRNRRAPRSYAELVDLHPCKVCGKAKGHSRRDGRPWQKLACIDCGDMVHVRCSKQYLYKQEFQCCSNPSCRFPIPAHMCKAPGTRCRGKRYRREKTHVMLSNNTNHRVNIHNFRCWECWGLKQCYIELLNVEFESCSD